MWNLTSRPRAASPHRWTNHSIGVYKEMESPLIIMPDKLSGDDAEIGILRARAVIPAVNIVTSAAPKPPKKRFLEAAAAAHELEEQQRLQQKQVENKGRTDGEDNSALMQLAEMCVYYQASSAGHPSGSWSPVTGAWKCVNHRVGAELEEPIDPTIYSISMSSAVQSVASPKAATPFWGWTNSRPLLQSEQEFVAQQHGQEEEENEEPLDLSGEETIRTNQQELIDHLVEKLCARPVSGKFSSLVQKKLSLLELPQPKIETSETAVDATTSTTTAAASQKNSSNGLTAALVPNSSSEVSSSIDSKDSVTAAVKDVRRDLPLKKRDPSSLQQQQLTHQQTASYDQQRGGGGGGGSGGGGGDFCDSSSTTTTTTTTTPIKPESPSAQVVTSTNTNSKKPAPRSCKGKRYLEFMYEGRITLGNNRSKRSGSAEPHQPSCEDHHQTPTPTCDQSSIGGTKKRQRHVKQHPAEPATTIADEEVAAGKTTFSLRGRNAKLRKLS